MWPGGKDGAGVAQRLINEIPPHEVFVSTCLGDCAVMRRKRPAARSVGIDLDEGVLRRWISRREQLPGLELYRCDAVEWLRHSLGWYRVATAGDAAGSDARSSDDGSGDGRSPRQPAIAAVATSGDGGSRHHRPLKMAAGSQSPNRATGDRQPQVPASPAAGWFIFADPPYLMATRSCRQRMYAHEPSEAWHVDLVETLIYAASSGAAVMCVHYPSPLYAEALQTWRTWTYRSMTRGGRMATEQVWCSYPRPEVLHDPRWLGADKREREKLMRRRRNLLDKIRRLSPLERQSLLDAIACGIPSP